MLMNAYFMCYNRTGMFRLMQRRKVRRKALLNQCKLTILLYLLKIYLKIVYCFIKLFTRQEDQVFFLSRQYNFLSYNYKSIIKKLGKEHKDIKVKVICQKINSDLNESFRDNEVTSNFFRTIKKLEKEIKYAIDYLGSLHTQMYYIAKSKVVVIDGYNIPVSVLKHKKDTTVIQIWHALAAIKKFGYQSIGYKDGVNPKVAKILKMHANYDYVISGSDAMKPFFAEAFNTSEDKVLSIGTPYLDYLLNDGKKQKEKIYEKYPILKEKINILYSPTFRKDGRDNIEEVIDSIDLDKYNLIVTYHDKDGNKINNNSRVLTCSDIPYRDLIKIADYVITDYSALSIEAAVVNAKVLLYVYDYEQYKKENGINIDLFKEFPKYTSTNIADLVKVIEDDTYDINILNNFRNKYVSNLSGNSTELVAKLIAGTMNNKDGFNAKELEKQRKEKVII